MGRINQPAPGPDTSLPSRAAPTADHQARLLGRTRGGGVLWGLGIMSPEPSAAHLAGRSDGVVTVEPVLERVGDFGAFLAQDFDEAQAYGPLRKAELIGRPVGTAEWIAEMEARTGMTLAPGKRGPAPKAVA